ncbi:MAG: preprotein translocase subunit SecE [Lachnospiraceae bacterium]|nr:preprotein translocase subunit SecE [Lachnospiraceae bacterium]
MAETVSTEKAPKKSWFKGLKAEFKKIIWPDKKRLVKQTIAVVVLSIIMCVLILIVDAIIKFGLDFII